jgi:hypothetical protein
MHSCSSTELRSTELRSTELPSGDRRGRTWHLTREFKLRKYNMYTYFSVHSTVRYKVQYKVCLLIPYVHIVISHMDAVGT